MRDAVSVLTVGWAGDAIRGSEPGGGAPRDPRRQPWRTSSEFYHGSARAGRDEFISLPTVLQQAAALTSIGDRPLIVVTTVADSFEEAAKDAWA
jgi:hypothetical protein